MKFLPYTPLPDLGFAILNGTQPTVLKDGMVLFMPLEPGFVPAYNLLDGRCMINLVVLGYLGSFIFPARVETVLRHAQKKNAWNFILTFELEGTEQGINQATGELDDPYIPIRVRFA